MDYTVLEKYEYKAPNYELKSADPRSAEEYVECAKKRRYYFDTREGIYKSNAKVKDGVTLLFAGDLLCQEKISEAYRTADGYDFSPCFEFIAPLLHSVDFAAGNLETVVSHSAPCRGEILSHEGPHFYNAPVQFLTGLSGAGFDMLTTENNHALDAGVRGLMETIENVKNFGFIQTGTNDKPGNKYVIVDICGFRVGFVAFGVTYNAMQQNLTEEGKNTLLNTYSYDSAAAIYQELKDKGAEYVICFPHWGKEYTDVLSEKQRGMARELAQIGYDLTIGAHAHVLQNFKLVSGKPVVYSLGNLLSPLNSKLKKGVEYSAVCVLKLSREDGELTSKVEFVPCRLAKNYMNVPYTVLPMLKSLGLSDEKEPAQKKTSRRVIKSLECKPSRMLDDFRLTEKGTALLEQREARLNSALAGLNKVEQVSPVSGPLTVPTRKFWDKFQRYHVEKKGLYKIFNNYAELVQIGNVAEIITLPTKVEDVPVTAVCSGKTGNATARLIYVGKKVQTLGEEAFKNFTALESVRLFSNLKVIEAAAFEGCVSMIGIMLPRSVTEVGAGAFRDCSSLKSVKIPTGVTKIADDAFQGCKKLTIYCEAGSTADKFAQAHAIPVKYMPLDSANAATEEADTDET